MSESTEGFVSTTYGILNDTFGGMLDPDYWDFAGAFAALGDAGIQQKATALQEAFTALMGNPLQAEARFLNAARIAASGAAALDGAAEQSKGSETFAFVRIWGR